MHEYESGTAISAPEIKSDSVNFRTFFRGIGYDGADVT